MKFTKWVESQSSWKQYSQDVRAFEPLTETIFRKENLTFRGLKTSYLGTNAVFCCGEYYIKFFLPCKSITECEIDYRTERFGLIHAERLGIRSPRLITYGVCEEQYKLYYIVSSMVDGTPLSSCLNSLSLEQKRNVGKQLREISMRLNIPCDHFNIRHIYQPSNNQRWMMYSKDLAEAREHLIRRGTILSSDDCFVHSDLNADNILIDKDHNVWIIDFADALLAPIIIEKAMVLCDAFQLDKGLMEGYGVTVPSENLFEELAYGILLHPFGMDIIEDNLQLDEHTFEGLYHAIKKQYEVKNPIV